MCVYIACLAQRELSMLSASLAWLHRNEKVLILSYTVIWTIGYSTNSMKWMVDRQGDIVLLKLGFWHLLSAWARKKRASFTSKDYHNMGSAFQVSYNSFPHSC